ncbi:serine hydrolase domain-containing protein [Vibrio genomosp. F10]|uniref:Serine hydrolase n=1 Tax=Vibrio genomosp. F10 str. ZF-129 TaxID=1187848 RepID=A0A1E5BK02_9VIBR|nr:serine hydrolase domain-containing protein [Vibrio genomosp. F10]OEE38041.1 serine hydrolase [Vibrio genomosp. F10 str. ZF-129]OEF03769.1 serine hydrolase [Vibrio genomosp. F10 str. 9ZD137]OEF08550.1 serine hydrolase [Vibrio genomosp. F10 str. 9ZB36]
MKIKHIALMVSALAAPATMASENPVAAALKAEGAMVNLPVEAAKGTYTNEFVASARENFNNFHWQMGGDHALYYSMNAEEFLPSTLVSPNEEYKPLVKALNKDLGNIKVETKAKGEMTMDEYLNDPHFRTQGFMLIHEGKIVYEAYPGMEPTDRHVWMSSAKTTVGVVVAMLVEEGKIDPQQSITKYVPELKDTVWDDVRVLDVLNHQTGLDNEETLASIMNPVSPVVRFFSSAFGVPSAATGEVESWIAVARDTERLEGEKAGEINRYASINTIVLTKMVENIEKTTWSAVFEERVWGKMTARQAALFNIAPDGMALGLGLLHTTLEDKARFGTLFTPSWEAVATEPVVKPEVIDIIRNSGDKATFAGHTKEASSVSAFNEAADYQSYQFDYIFDDGAMGKSGNLGQFIYVDPARDFVGVVFSTNPYHSGYGENKSPALMRSAAKFLADK